MKRNRIDENIALITEMLSISDEVDAATNNIFTDIQNGYRNYSFKKVKEGLFKANATKEYTLWGHRINVAVEMYEFINRDTFQQDKNKVTIDNRFQPGTRTLTLTIVFLFGWICKDLGGDLLYHEIEDIYYWAMGKKNNPKFKSLTNDAYDYAVNIIQQSKDDIERRIAWIIYYSNPHEQDAYVHQYYIQCQQSVSRFVNKETNVDKHYKHYKECVEWLQQNFDAPYVQSCLQAYREYGYAPNNILKYVEKGLNRLYERMGHVRCRRITLSENPMPLIFPQTIGDLLEDNEDLIEKVLNRLCPEN